MSQTIGTSLDNSNCQANNVVNTANSAATSTGLLPSTSSAGSTRTCNSSTPLVVNTVAVPTQPSEITQAQIQAGAQVQQAQIQANAQVQQAQIQANSNSVESAINKEIIDNQIQSDDEHWFKAYWRPAMGWLYMSICFMDFIGFPCISMFLPVIMHAFGISMQYVAWQPLTLQSGGAIHFAFGGILGITAWHNGKADMAKLGN